MLDAVRNFYGEEEKEGRSDGTYQEHLQHRCWCSTQSAAIQRSSREDHAQRRKR